MRARSSRFLAALLLALIFVLDGCGERGAARAWRKTVAFTAEMKADPIHPNARGYRRVAATLAARLGNAVAI